MGSVESGRKRNAGRARFTLVTPVLALACASAGAQQPAGGAEAAPPSQGFSSWNVQFLYGTDFQEPFNPNDVAKGIMTFENASGWSWGSSFFFVDVLKSDGEDSYATEVYAEWFPSASLSKLTGKEFAFAFVRDISVTMGINAGTKNTGAAPRAFVPGLTFDLAIPGFKFFSLGAYAYIDERGRFEAAPSDCDGSTGYQITPAWSLPIDLGGVKLSFDGFVDFIGEHGACASQILSQPQLKVDVGSFWSMPDKFYAGIEWQYWDNKFGIEGLNESFPQLLVVWAL